jgi:hypothetical protein
MTAMLHIPLRAQLAEQSMMRRLRWRQALTLACYATRFEFHAYIRQERLPPDPRKGYAPAPGMANRSTK